MTTPIAEAIRIVAGRARPTEAIELRRLAAMVQRMEEFVDEIAANGQTDAQPPREGNVVDFRGKSGSP